MSEVNGTQEQSNAIVKAYSQLMQFAQSNLMSRAALARQFGKAFGGKRDYYETLGYDHDLHIEKYDFRFRRQDIASRIVRAFPDETWRLTPRVYEDDTENETQFEKEWETLHRKLQLFGRLYRADVLACLGRFSVLYIGFNDATSIEGLATPVSRSNTRTINFVSAYSEKHVEVAELDNDILSPRFGMPIIYEIDFNRDNSSLAGRRNSRQERARIHWERVIHIADDVIEDDIYGTPKLESIYNRLDDLVKVVGGSSEMFWRNARKDLIIEANADAHLSPDSLVELREKAEEYVHDLNRVLGLEGAEAKSLPIEVASPADHVNVILMMIASSKKIPLRILVGSERGELASSQDRVNWAEQNIVRQQTYAEPTILRPFIDRCISTRVLPTPREGPDGYTVEWPPLLTEDPSERANRINTMSNALDTITRGQTLSYFPLREIRVELLELEEESPYENDEIIDAREAEDASREDAEDDIDESGGQGTEE